MQTTKKGHVSVVAIACREESGMKIVLVHSREHENHEPFLKFPGGRRKNGETPEETAVREVGEETGIAITADDLIHVAKLDRFGRGEPYEYHIFLAVVDSLAALKSEYVEEDERVLIVLSLDLAEIDAFPMHVLPLHRPFVEELRMAASMYV